MNEITTIRIIVRWILVFISCSAVVCMFWFFVGVFFKKTWIKVLTVLLLSSVSIGAYVLNHRTPNVVRMQEDVLYIKPNSNERD